MPKRLSRSKREDTTAPSISGVLATNGGVSPSHDRYDNLYKAKGEKHYNEKIGSDNHAYENTNV